MFTWTTSCFRGYRRAFKLNPQLRLITAPVILVIDGEERIYPDGESLTALEFDQRYVIDSIRAQGNAVVVTLKINDRVNEISWIGEEAVSFMYEIIWRKNKSITFLN